MSFTPRSYEAITRDMLTTLTGGTVRESLVVPAGDVLLLPEKLANRPVRRISHLEGVTLVGRGADEKEIPYRFTSADFELVSTTGDESEKDAIRFRENGRRPAPGSTLTVNYYPVQTDPVPLTDLNVGSVVRTLMETISREMAVEELQLEHIYKSAFVETAERGDLDKVVALVGVRRLPTGHAVSKIRFSRRPGTPGRITVRAGTPVTDASGNRYLTLEQITLEPNESTRDVLAGAEAPGTEEVAEGALDRLEVAIAGIAEVTNPEPSRRLNQPETDDELRRRARGALHGTIRGTLDAIRFGLLSISGVKDVSIQEAPNGVAGELKLEVAYSEPTPDVRAEVARRIEELRPAGIRVVTGDASSLRLNVRVELTLAGASLPSADIAALTASTEDRLAALLLDIPPGGTVRRAQLSAAALSDPQIVDAAVALLPDGAPETEQLTLEVGTVLDVVRPFAFPPPVFENAADAEPVVSTVGATLPIHLAAGVTLAEASDAINVALNGHLASRQTDAPLTVDGLAAAIRDDSRFALAREDVLVIVEGGGRFLQLTDGVGSYAPAPNETLERGVITIEPREGGV